jgi:hypothetical protein
LRPPKVGPLEACASELCPPELCPPEVGPPEEGLIQYRYTIK